MSVNFVKEAGIINVNLRKCERDKDIQVITGDAFVLITLCDGEIIDVEVHLDPKAVRELSKVLKK